MHELPPLHTHPKALPHVQFSLMEILQLLEFHPLYRVRQKNLTVFKMK